MIAEPVSLEQQFRLVLLKLEMISHGSTQAWNSDGRGGFERDMPPGEMFPPHVHYRWLWNKQHSDEGRHGVLEAAKDALEAITRRAEPAVTALSDREMLRLNVLDCKGVPSQEVAIRYRCNARDVHDIRVKEQVDAEFGLPVVDWPEAAAEKARKLAENRMSERAIAMVLKVSPSTVRRMLGRAA